jgi:hypothetical protein
LLNWWIFTRHWPISGPARAKYLDGKSLNQYSGIDREREDAAAPGREEATTMATAFGRLAGVTLFGMTAEEANNFSIWTLIRAKPRT